MATAHRATTAARLPCRACLSPNLLPQRGDGHTTTSPPKEGLRLPKCRSFRPHPWPCGLRRALQPPSFHPQAASAPAGRLPATRTLASQTAPAKILADLRKSRPPRWWPPLPFSNRRLLFRPHHLPNDSITRPPSLAIQETLTRAKVS